MLTLPHFTPPSKATVSTSQVKVMFRGRQEKVCPPLHAPFRRCPLFCVSRPEPHTKCSGEGSRRLEAPEPGLQRGRRGSRPGGSSGGQTLTGSCWATPGHSVHRRMGGASRQPFMMPTRPPSPVSRMHVRAGLGRAAPPGREPCRSPLSEAAGDANPWLSPRILLGKALHIPAQHTVWEQPAAITATASARVPKDDGVAQETGPQGAIPRGLSIGTEVACSNLCHSPRLPPVCSSRSQTHSEV